MPWEYPPTLRPAAAASPTTSSTSSARRRGSPAARAMTRRWLRPVRPGWKPVVSSTAPTVRRGEASSLYRTPSMRALPASGRAKPSRIRSVVVLPAPLGPRNPVTVPEGAVKLTPSTASVGPYRLLTSLTSIIQARPSS